jgi:hypothetical protein
VLRHAGVSKRSILLALILFLGLSLANLIYSKERLAVVNNPYSSGGSAAGSILSAAAAGDRVARERTLFILREIAALGISGALFALLPGRSAGAS